MAHLRSVLPGLRIAPYEAGSTDSLAITAAGKTYQLEWGQLEYAVLAKITPAAQSKPAFLICGQTAAANRAAARYLATHYRDFIRAHGIHGRFCVLLRVLEPNAYGATVVEQVRDSSSEVFAD